MKKLILSGLMLLLALCMSVPVFAGDVPVVPGGALIEGDENDIGGIALTEEELQQRKAAYDEILALSETDKNILAVRLSDDSSLVFVSIATDEDNMLIEKEYAKKFIEQYGSFVGVTNNVYSYDIAGEGGIGSNTMGGVGIVGGVDISGTIGGDPAKSYLWVFFLTGALLVTAALSLFLLRRNGLVRARQTAGGGVTAGASLMSAGEAVAAVRETTVTPEDYVFDEIVKDI